MEGEGMGGGEGEWLVTMEDNSLNRPFAFLLHKYHIGYLVIYAYFFLLSYITLASC